MTQENRGVVVGGAVTQEYRGVAVGGAVTDSYRLISYILYLPVLLEGSSKRIRGWQWVEL